MRKTFLATIGLAALSPFLAAPAFAQVATTTFNVQITIQAECLINSATALDFGTTGVIAADIDAASEITVQCTTGTPFDIALDEGLGAGATTAARLMTLGAATVEYSLYSDAGRSDVWGETAGTDTVASTGTGAPQIFPVYGRVPAQATPATGVYNDTVTVTVTY